MAALWRHCNASDLESCKWLSLLGPVSLRLMTSQLKDVVIHMQKLKTENCIFCGVWVQNFVCNFKGALWNFTQNFEPTHRKICILRGVKTLTIYDILELWHKCWWDGPQRCYNVYLYFNHYDNINIVTTFRMGTNYLWWVGAFLYVIYCALCDGVKLP